MVLETKIKGTVNNVYQVSELKLSSVKEISNYFSIDYLSLVFSILFAYLILLLLVLFY